MSIDQRRDHFFRIPDPLQSKAAGAPDVCTGCHKDKSPEWAAQRIGEWSPNIDRSWQDRAPFIAFRNGDQSPKILQALVAYMGDTRNPAIARATGLDRIRDASNTHLGGGFDTFLRDDSDLVRAAAAGLTRQMPALDKGNLLKPLLIDPLRDVRQAAALELAAGKGAGMSQVEFAALQKAIAEYQASRAANADMPETHLALAGLALSMKDWPAAEAAFNQAVTMDPQLDSAWVMLARLRSALGDEPGAAQYLEKALGYQPHSANVMFEMAELELRRGDDKKAIDWYRQIVASDPSRIDARLAMASTALRMGDSAMALDATAQILTLEPKNVDALVIKAVAHYARGEMDQAKQNAARAKQILPSVQMPKELEALVGNGQ